MADDPEPDFVILKVECRYDRVAHIVVKVLQPGILDMEWDNVKVCGQGT